MSLELLVTLSCPHCHGDGVLGRAFNERTCPACEGEGSSRQRVTFDAKALQELAKALQPLLEAKEEQ